MRLHWHVNEILRDGSPWAFTPPLAQVGLITMINALLFWAGLLFLFWLVDLKTDSRFENKDEIQLKLGQKLSEVSE